MGTVIISGCRSLRNQRDFELRRAGRILEFGEATGERKNDGLDAANAGCEEMGINQQFHWRGFDEEADAARCAVESPTVTGLRPTRATPVRMASTVAAMWCSGDHDRICAMTDRPSPVKRGRLARALRSN